MKLLSAFFICLLAEAARPSRRHRIKAKDPEGIRQDFEVIESTVIRWMEGGHADQHESASEHQEGGTATKETSDPLPRAVDTHPSNADTEEANIARNEAAEVTNSQADSATKEKVDLMNQLVADLRHRDAEQLELHLKALGDALRLDPASLDVNLKLPIREFQSPGPGNSESVNKIEGSMTLLAAAASAGWLSGVKAIISWNSSRDDSGKRLTFEDTASTQMPSAPLILAAKHGHSEVVAFLLEHGASAAVFDEDGFTPLELAVKGCSLEVARSLLETPQSRLGNGLKPLRIAIASKARKLPDMRDHWPFGKLPDDKDYMDDIRRLIPLGFRPLQQEVEIVGVRPGDWILHYQNRVMVAFASSRLCDPASHHRLGGLLYEHEYVTFALDYTLCVAFIASVLGCFGIASFVLVRLRVFGWCDAPVSLADLITGAYDPLRCTDPDFDPSNKAKLPYRNVGQHLASNSSSLGKDSLSKDFVFAGKAMLGIFSSWLLLFIRIPPLKDPYDEDYHSDDDDDKRAKVREDAAKLGKTVRLIEVTLRSAMIVLILIQLVVYHCRFGDAAILVLLYVYHACFAACVARNMVPSAAKPTLGISDETSEDFAADGMDAAFIAQSLFSVQHGPKWGRAISTTRGTAAHPNRRVRRSRSRPRKLLGEKSSSGGDDDEKEGKDAKVSADGDADKEMTASETTFSDRFQRSALKSGILHVRHRRYITDAVMNLLNVLCSILWIFSLGRLVTGSYTSFYERVTATDLFRVYGVPGTSIRFSNILLEVCLMAFCGEKLFAVTNTLSVALLVMDQRIAALSFIRKNQPPGKDSSSTDEQYVKESIRCAEFGLELSYLRWLVLREPILQVYMCTLVLLAVSICFFVPNIFPRLPGLQTLQVPLSLDPTVPLSLGITLISPLLCTIAAGVRANAASRKLRQKLMTLANEILTEMQGKDGTDVAYVKLRVPVGEALQGAFLCWHQGRELGRMELLLLSLIFLVAIIMALTSFILALTASNAVPNA